MLAVAAARRRQARAAAAAMPKAYAAPKVAPRRPWATRRPRVRAARARATNASKSSLVSTLPYIALLGVVLLGIVGLALGAAELIGGLSLRRRGRAHGDVSVSET